MKIIKVKKSDGRIAYIKKSKINDEEFDKFLWKKTPPSVKIENAWQLVIDAYIIRNETERLKLKKIITIRTKNGKILKKIKL